MIEVHLITEKELSETLRTARNDLLAVLRYGVVVGE
jgi:hypothetical protein